MRAIFKNAYAMKGEIAAGLTAGAMFTAAIVKFPSDWDEQVRRRRAVHIHWVWQPLCHRISTCSNFAVHRKIPEQEDSCEEAHFLPDMTKIHEMIAQEKSRPVLQEDGILTCGNCVIRSKRYDHRRPLECPANWFSISNNFDHSYLAIEANKLLEKHPSLVQLGLTKQIIMNNMRLEHAPPSRICI